MIYIIAEHENSYTGIRIEFRTILGSKKFAVQRSHKEKLEDPHPITKALGITETFIEDEERIFDDFFKANELYDLWLRDY